MLIIKSKYAKISAKDSSVARANAIISGVLISEKVLIIKSKYAKISAKDISVARALNIKKASRNNFN